MTEPFPESASSREEDAGSDKENTLRSKIALASSTSTLPKRKAGTLSSSVILNKVDEMPTGSVSIRDSNNELESDVRDPAKTIEDRELQNTPGTQQYSFYIK